MSLQPIKKNTSMCSAYAGKQTIANSIFYFLSTLIVISTGTYYIVALNTEDEELQKKRYKTLKIMVSIALMLICVMLTMSSVIGEWAWYKRCNRFEAFVNEKVSYLKRELIMDNVVDKITTGVMDTLSRKIPLMNMLR